MNSKIVLITGASGGLGTNVTQAFLDAGATVVGVSRSITQAENAHPNFHAMPASVTNANSACDLVHAVQQKHQRIDALVHLVGGFAGGTRLDETDDVTLDRMLELNFRSAFLMLRAAVPVMRDQKSGCILAVGSRVAVEPAPMAAAYGASKAALVSLIKSVAQENKDCGISANVVLPATMDTAANRKAMPKADFSKWVSPDAVAKLLTDLAQNPPLSGAVIPIYGGEL